MIRKENKMSEIILGLIVLATVNTAVVGSLVCYLLILQINKLKEKTDDASTIIINKTKDTITDDDDFDDRTTFYN
jgi:L-cystine uptake protein TcyP (sodium:dicarboxylate symporter family)